MDDFLSKWKSYFFIIIIKNIDAKSKPKNLAHHSGALLFERCIKAGELEPLDGFLRPFVGCLQALTQGHSVFADDAVVAHHLGRLVVAFESGQVMP